MNAHATRVAEVSPRYPTSREALSAPALRTFFNIAEQWKLRMADQRKLLGDPPESTFYKWKRERDGGARARHAGADQLPARHLAVAADPVSRPGPGRCLAAQAEHRAAVRRPLRAGAHVVGQRRRPVSWCANTWMRSAAEPGIAEPAMLHEGSRHARRAYRMLAVSAIRSGQSFSWNPDVRRSPAAQTHPLEPRVPDRAQPLSRRSACTTASPIRPISMRCSRSRP